MTNIPAFHKAVKDNRYEVVSNDFVEAGDAYMKIDKTVILNPKDYSEYRCYVMAIESFDSDLKNLLLS